MRVLLVPFFKIVKILTVLCYGITMICIWFIFSLVPNYACSLQNVIIWYWMSLARAMRVILALVSHKERWAMQIIFNSLRSPCWIIRFPFPTYLYTCFLGSLGDHDMWISSYFLFLFSPFKAAIKVFTRAHVQIMGLMPAKKKMSSS